MLSQLPVQLPTCNKGTSQLGKSPFLDPHCCFIGSRSNRSKNRTDKKKQRPGESRGPKFPQMAEEVSSRTRDMPWTKTITTPKSMGTKGWPLQQEEDPELMLDSQMVPEPGSFYFFPLQTALAFGKLFLPWAVITSSSLPQVYKNISHLPYIGLLWRLSITGPPVISPKVFAKPQVILVSVSVISSHVSKSLLIQHPCHKQNRTQGS
jgi:hypothetical protein